MTDQPDLAAPEERTEQPRFRWGWIALFTMLGLVVLLELYQSATRETSDVTQYNAERTSLQQYLMFDALKGLPGAATSAGKAKQDLREALNEVAPDRKTEATAAKLYAVMRTELGEEVESTDLEVLKQSKEQVDRTFYDLYAGPQMTPEQIRRRTQRFATAGMIHRLARAQALAQAGDPSVRETLASSMARNLLLVGAGGCMLLLTGLLMWLVYAIARSSGKLEPLGNPLKGISKTDADLLAVRGAQLFAFFLVASSFVLPIVLGGMHPMAASFISGAIMILVVVYFAKVPVRDKLFTLQDLGIDRRNFGRHVALGLAAFVANIPVVLILALIGTTLFRFLPPPEHPATNLLLSNRDLWSISALIFAAAIAAPIWEEVMFRGILYQAMSRFTSVALAAVGSSLLFGAIHPTGAAAVMALAAVGAMSCALVYHTRSLVPSIVMHAAHNATLVTATLLIG